MASPAELNPDYRNHPDNRAGLDHIPGNWGLPVIGETFPMIKDVWKMVDEHYKQFGPISKLSAGFQKGLLVVGPDNYQKIYLDREQVFSTEMGYDRSIGQFYKGGLLMRDGDDHRFQRRMFQTAFKNEPMRGYVGMMNPILRQHMDAWQGKPDFLFFDAIKKALLEVGAKVFIGIDDLGEEADRMNRAFLDISEEGLMGLFKWDLPGLKFHKGMNGKRYMEKYFGDLIPVRRQGDGTDMLSFMCKEKMEDGSFFPDSDLIPHTSFLLFAAHDTTTSALCHMIFYTAKHPEWQDKLRAEAQALGKATLDYDDLDNLPLMELVFKEALRLRPSVSMMTRRTIAETELFGRNGEPVKIPADTMLFIPPVYNHTMPEYWDNPMQFDPMRFAPPREEHKRHSFSYVPFGGGAHKCIGMHFANMLAKCFMHQFLLNYKYSVAPDYNPHMEAFPLPKPGDNLPLKIERLQ
ncbi:MAG: cytochrome P450 [Gammaproteobacteria bacterium]|nr:MAG: cytochrome P450 [Gammaproteobacteria bacterium]